MKEVIEILTKVGALLPNGHFIGTSGKHLDTYITKDALLPHTEEVSKIGKLMAEKASGYGAEVVVGPALGGIVFSQWTAYHLTQLLGKEVLSFYTEKTPDGDQIFTRGYDAKIKGKKVLVVEDTVTTAGSAMKVVRAVQEAGGEVVHVLVITNRDPDHVNSQSLGIPFDALCDLPLVSYTPEECPMCRNNVPVNIQFGHGKKFLESKK